MRTAPALLVATLAAASLAGCIETAPEPVRNAVLSQVPFLASQLGRAPAFGPEVLVDARMGATEPSLVVDPDGRVFVAAPTGLNPAADPATHRYSGQLWRSEDGGQSFEHLRGLGVAGLYGPSFGGGDSDIASDAKGDLYAIDLWLGNVGFLASRDHGDTWMEGTPLTFATPGTDRQWLDVNMATGEVYVAVNSLSTGLWVAKSADGGKTFVQQTLAVAHADRGGCVCPPGVLTVDEATGNVYLPYYANPGGVGLAVSKDGGSSFALLEVPLTDTARLPDDQAGEVGGSFVASATDDAGNLYLAWESVTQAGRRIALQASPDAGASWTEPMFPFDPPDGLQMFPWLAAGAPGRVALAWYEQGGDGAWDVRLAFTDRALQPLPPWGVTQLNRAPILEGDYERSLLGDFFEIALGPDGALHAVWNARLADGTDALVYAQQADGPRLRDGPAPTAGAPAKPPEPSLPQPKAPPPGAVAEEVVAEAAGLVPPPRRAGA